MDLVVRRYLASGIVQGVGFRWFVQERARSMDIGGWVRNEADGSVRVVASGTEKQLAGFEALLREGPPSSRVDALVVEAEVNGSMPGPSGSTNALTRPFHVVR